MSEQKNDVGGGLGDMIQQGLQNVAVKHGVPMALGYMDRAQVEQGLHPAEHLTGEVAGLGELPTNSPESLAASGFGGYSFLPSGQAAYDLTHGQNMGRAVAGVLFYTTMRAALVGAGVYLAGERDRTKLLKYSFAGAAAIEAWVLWWSLARGSPTKR